MQRDRTPKAITREVIAKEVAYVLRLPVTQWPGTEYKVVNTVFKMITEALLRGESVEIRGFGTFFVRARAPTQFQCYYFHGRRKRGSFWETRKFPAKKSVVFRPSVVLSRMLNEP